MSEVTPVEGDKLKAVYRLPLCLLFSLPLFGRGLRTLPRCPPPQGQSKRPSATPGIGPTPYGAASPHSHTESRGFHSPQTGPPLSAPETEEVKTKGQICFEIMGQTLYAGTYTKAHWLPMNIETARITVEYH